MCSEKPRGSPRPDPALPALGPSGGREALAPLAPRQRQLLSDTCKQVNALPICSASWNPL